MSKFETVAALLRKQLEERDQPVGVGLKVRWQLKQDGPGLVAEQRQAVFEQFQAIHRILRKAFPVGDEFGCLPSEDKIVPGLLVPAFDGLGSRRTIKYGVELGRRKLTGIVLKLVLDRQSLGKERPAPGTIVPPRCADQNLRHGNYGFMTT